jgi:hypothetical protein
MCGSRHVEATLPDKSISMGEALRRVGEARFGTTWLGEPSDEEIEVHVGGPIPYKVVRVRHGNRFEEIDWQEAERRDARREHQYQCAECWLYRYCFSKTQRQRWNSGPFHPHRSRGWDFRFARGKFERLLASAFPSIPTSPAPPRPGVSRISAETKCQQWLEEEMQKNPRERPEAKDWYCKQAIKNFSGLSERGFDRAWAAAIKKIGADKWSKAGRLKDKSSQIK